MHDSRKTEVTGSQGCGPECQCGDSRGASGLPLQNLLLAAVVIGTVSGGALWLNAQTGFPFGRRSFSEASRALACSAALALAAALSLLSARGVAKLLLLPRRQTRHYGYWLLALNALLGALPLVGFDLLATRTARWWSWASATWHWQDIALPNLAGWCLVNVVALLLATPALIDKRPVPSLPGPRPLGVWFALNAAVAVGCRSHVSDAAVAVLTAPVLVVTMLAFNQHRHAVANCDAGPDPK